MVCMPEQMFFEVYVITENKPALRVRFMAMRVLSRVASIAV
jgi:hypothetical protein